MKYTSFLGESGKGGEQRLWDMWQHVSKHELLREGTQWRNAETTSQKPHPAWLSAPKQKHLEVRTVHEGCYLGCDFVS